jgi:hypothetical protein
VDAWSYAPRRKKWYANRLVIGFVLGTFLLGAGAMAAWLISVAVPPGAGRSRTGALVAPMYQQVLDAQIAEVGLFPGQTGSLTFRINNPNVGGLNLIALNGGPATITPSSGSCPASDFTFNPQTGLNIPVPQGTTVVVVPGAITLKSTASTDCQNLTVDVGNINSQFSTP